MSVGTDMKGRRKNWWHEKAVAEVTWNHLILAMIVLALVISYASLDGNWVYGLR